MEFPLYPPKKTVIYEGIKGKVVGIGYVYSIVDDDGVVHNDIFEKQLSLPTSPLVLSGKLTQEEFDHRNKSLNTKYAHRSHIRMWFKGKYPISSEIEPECIPMLMYPFEWIPFGTRERIFRYYQDNPNKISNIKNESLLKIGISLNDIKDKINMPLIEIPKNKDPIYKVGEYVRCIRTHSVGIIKEIIVNDEEHEYIVNVCGNCRDDNPFEKASYISKDTFDEYVLEPFDFDVDLDSIIRNN
jgi:hypothetical protein